MAQSHPARRGRDTGSGQGMYNVEPRHGRRCGPSLKLSKGIEYLGARYAMAIAVRVEEALQGGSGILEDGSTGCNERRRCFSSSIVVMPRGKVVSHPANAGSINNRKRDKRQKKEAAASGQGCVRKAAFGPFSSLLCPPRFPGDEAIAYHQSVACAC
ncbi:hypothetical protein TARUN_2863 [Trichoderma arundinaceum]|uniref:Uncharacterized protein n=1 Tax=Trichoderma arundinaceum TaxID=490622 RepID=A0A395NTT4_TRIAR|nr:hypothetical protein TARUN_2863 [Trichoderma arundinaceum]